MSKRKRQFKDLIKDTGYQQSLNEQESPLTISTTPSRSSMSSGSTSSSSPISPFTSPSSSISQQLSPRPQTPIPSSSSSTTSSSSGSTSSTLTPEQRALFKQRRQLALQKLEQRKQQTSIPSSSSSSSFSSSSQLLPSPMSNQRRDSNLSETTKRSFPRQNLGAIKNNISKDQTSAYLFHGTNPNDTILGGMANPNRVYNDFQVRPMMQARIPLWDAYANLKYDYIPNSKSGIGQYKYNNKNGIFNPYYPDNIYRDNDGVFQLFHNKTEPLLNEPIAMSSKSMGEYDKTRYGISVGHSEKRTEVEGLNQFLSPNSTLPIVKEFRKAGVLPPNERGRVPFENTNELQNILTRLSEDSDYYKKPFEKNNISYGVLSTREPCRTGALNCTMFGRDNYPKDSTYDFLSLNRLPDRGSRGEGVKLIADRSREFRNHWVKEMDRRNPLSSSSSSPFPFPNVRNNNLRNNNSINPIYPAKTDPFSLQSPSPLPSRLSNDPSSRSRFTSPFFTPNLTGNLGDPFSNNNVLQNPSSSTSSTSLSSSSHFSPSSSSSSSSSFSNPQSFNSNYSLGTNPSSLSPSSSNTLSTSLPFQPSFDRDWNNKFPPSSSTSSTSLSSSSHFSPSSSSSSSSSSRLKRGGIVKRKVKSHPSEILAKMLLERNGIML